MNNIDLDDLKRIFFKRIKLDFIEPSSNLSDDNIVYYFMCKGKQKVLREIREIENNNE